MKRFGGFERTADDAYDTPPEAVAPLLRRLEPRTRFVEPCAGRGALRDVLEAAGHRCVHAGDIAPRGPQILRLDGRILPAGSPVVITNPPYARPVFLPLLEAWLPAGAWLLIPLDWVANRWFAPYAGYLAELVPIGRVRWFPGSPHTSAENYVWARFTPEADHAVVRPRR